MADCVIYDVCMPDCTIGDPEGLQVNGLKEMLSPEIANVINNNFKLIVDYINGGSVPIVEGAAPLSGAGAQNFEVPATAFSNASSPTKAEAIAWISSQNIPAGSVVVYPGSGSLSDPQIAFWIGSRYPVDLKGSTPAAP